MNQTPQQPAPKPQLIQWIEKRVSVNSLRPFEDNPRTITEVQYAKLKNSLLEDGYHSRIKATNDLRVIGGHQRIRAMRELGFDNIPILVPDREISDEQFKRILIRDNVSNGQWDVDALANTWELEELREWGVDAVMNIAPEGKDEEGNNTGGAWSVQCPQCQHQFPVKGHKV